MRQMRFIVSVITRENAAFMVVGLTSQSGRRDNSLRILGIVLAVALLNLGFYFILWFLAAIVAGFVGGFFISRPQVGASVGFIGSILSYLPLLQFLELIAPTGGGILSVIGAALILALLGGLGGFIGSIVGKRASRAARIG